MSVVATASHQGLPTRQRGEGWAGALAMVPMVAGLAPFALVLGSAIAEHVTPVAGWAGIWPIFSGSAHLIVLQVSPTGGGDDDLDCRRVRGPRQLRPSFAAPAGG